MTSGPRKTAERLLASCGAEKAGNDTIYWPSNDDIEALARDYLARTSERPKLGQLATVFITTPVVERVVERFAAQFARVAACVAPMERYTSDDVRRWLTDAAIDAKERRDGSWTVSMEGIDLTMRVMFAGRLAVITGANLRTSAPTRKGRYGKVHS